jgi:hypothetical protein
MKLIRQFTAVALSLAITTVAFAGISPDKAVYLGGTVTAKTGQEGLFDLKGTEYAVFRSKKEDEIRIPYAAVTSIEYGQKAGRRVGAAVATSILVSPVGLALLLSKKRKHIVTIGWTVDGKNDAAVFELGKTAIRPALATLEARTGHKIEYESEDARKNIGR